MSKQMANRQAVFRDIDKKREQQDEQWGGPEHDDLHNTEDWRDFTKKFLRRAQDHFREGNPEKEREALVDAAALLVAAIESHDRKTGRHNWAQQLPVDEATKILREADYASLENKVLQEEPQGRPDILKELQRVQDWYNTHQNAKQFKVEVVPPTPQGIQDKEIRVNISMKAQVTDMDLAQQVIETPGLHDRTEMLIELLEAQQTQADGSISAEQALLLQSIAHHLGEADSLWKLMDTATLVVANDLSLLEARFQVRKEHWKIASPEQEEQYWKMLADSEAHYVAGICGFGTNGIFFGERDNRVYVAEPFPFDDYSDCYTISASWSEEAKAFIAVVEEFPSVSATGPTEEQAVKDLQGRLRAVVLDLRAKGHHVPEPKSNQGR